MVEISDGLYLATWRKCSCALTLGPRQTADKMDVEIVVVGGRECENFPHCWFPVELACTEADLLMSENAVDAKYELLQEQYD